MASTFNRIKGGLPAAWNTNLNIWENLVTGHPDIDELGFQVGEVVCRNIRSDGAFSAKGLRGFFESLLANHPDAGKWPDSVAAVLAYQSCCRALAHQRQGPAARSVGGLWRVIPEPVLRGSINLANGRPPSSVGVVWGRFRKAYNDGDLNTLRILLEGSKIHPRGFQVFATFASPDPHSPPWADPGYWLDAGTACAALGLSKDWLGYRKGDSIWILEYSLHPSVPVVVPTCADADWRSIFRPSKTRKTGYGLTTLLGPLRAGLSPRKRHPDFGMPEVVHVCISFRDGSSMPALAGDYAELLQVRHLGTHLG